jgi:hypothetical protein
VIRKSARNGNQCAANSLRTSAQVTC